MDPSKSDPTIPDAKAGFFRCPVQPDQANATIHIGRRVIPATLQEQSIDGFTLLVDARQAVRLRVGKKWVLKTDSEYTRVHAEWMFHAENGRVQLAVRRLEDLRRAEDSAWRWTLWPRRRRGLGESGGHELAFVGIVMLVLMTLSLPGIGDHLGTAPRIQAAVEGLLSGF